MAKAALAIAYAMGYSSPSAFIAAFRKLSAQRRNVSCTRYDHVPITPKALLFILRPFGPVVRNRLDVDQRGSIKAIKGADDKDVAFYGEQRHHARQRHWIGPMRRAHGKHTSLAPIACGLTERNTSRGARSNQ